MGAITPKHEKIIRKYFNNYISNHAGDLIQSLPTGKISPRRAIAKYRTSEEGKLAKLEAQQRYKRSEKGKEAQLRAAQKYEAANLEKRRKQKAEWARKNYQRKKVAATELAT